MKTPTSSPRKHANSNEQSHTRDPFFTDRDLIHPAVFAFVCGALVLAIVAIIFLVMG